jgi:probable rRNA maturation factor
VIDRQDNITVICADPRWRKSFAAIHEDVQQAVGLALAHEGCGDATLNILFADNARVQELNHQFRGKDMPTNVLSFPSGEEGFLGDIALAYGVVRDEKTAQSKTWRAHTLHMVLHGVLHLLGFDHEDDDDAEEMEALEIALLAQLNIANPYE